MSIKKPDPEKMANHTLMMRHKVNKKKIVAEDPTITRLKEKAAWRRKMEDKEKNGAPKQK
jgi:hypothetical protein